MLKKLLFIITIIMLTACSENTAKSTQTGVVGENQPITRAEASRMLALNIYNIEEINKMERKITFDDTDISKWYDKYINAAYTAGIIAGVDENHFAPDEYLTLKQAQFLLDAMKEGNKVKLQYSPDDKDKPIPCNIWITAFEKNIDTSKLQTKTIKIYADKTNYNALGDNMYITDAGITLYEGYENLSSDKEIDAILNGNAIAALKTINNVSQYENMNVTDSESKYINVKVPGGTKKYSIGENTISPGDTVNIKINENGEYTAEKQQ